MYNPADGYTNAMALEGGVCFFLCRDYQQFADLCEQYNADPLDERYQLVTAITPPGSLVPDAFPIGTAYASLEDAPQWAVKFAIVSAWFPVLPSEAFAYRNHERVPPVYGARWNHLIEHGRL